MASVFISYSRKDGDFVKGLEKTLNDQHRDAWVDWRDIPPTAEWWREICSAIDNAHSFAFVVSPDSVTSTVCNQELDYAIKQHKRLIPIIRRDVSAAQIPKPLAILHWIFFREEDDFATALQSLVGAIDTDLDWVRAHTRLLVRSNEWDAKEKDKSFLLQGRDLEQAERWLAQGADKMPSPTTVQTLYIQTSRQAATRFQRRLLGGVFIALLVAIGLAIYAFNQQRIATEEKNNAVEARKGEETQRKNAQDRQKEAEEASDEARESARQANEAAEKERKAREDEARQRGIALAKGLAARSELMVAQKGNLLHTATLLAVESMRRYPSLEADQALRKSLALLPKQVADMPCALDGEVKQGTFSPDGKYLATLMKDGDVRIWETLNGRLVRRLKIKDPKKIFLSPNASHLVTIEAVGNVRVWNYLDGTEVKTLPHPGVHDATYSANGEFLATVGSDKTTRIWDIAGYEEIVSMPNREPMLFVALRPDASEIISWNAHSAEIFRSPGSPAQRIDLGILAGVNFEYSPDGKYLAEVASANFTTVLFKVDSREQLTFDDRHWDAAFSGDSRYVALASPEWDASTYFLPSCDRAGKTFEFNASGLLKPRHLQGRASCKQGAPVHHDDSVERVALSHDGTYLGTIGRDRTARVWEAYRGREVLRILEEVEGPIRDIAFPAGGHLVSAWGGKACRTWEATGHRQSLVMMHDRAVFDVTFSQDGRLIGSASKDGTARVWEAATGREVDRFKLGEHVSTVNFNPDASKLLLNGRYIWDLKAQKTAAKPEVLDLKRASVVSRDWQVIADVSDDNRITVRDFRTGAELSKRSHDGKIEPIALSPDGCCLAGVVGGKEIIVWHWKRNKELLRSIANHKVDSVSFDSKGRHLAVIEGNKNTNVDIWAVSSGTRVKGLPHQAEVTSVSFDPESKFVVTSSHDQWARVWNLTTGQVVAQFKHDTGVWAAEFSPDGKYIVSGGDDSDFAVRLWLWRPADLIAEACARLSQNLTSGEWRQYLGGENEKPTCSVDNKQGE